MMDINKGTKDKGEQQRGRAPKNTTSNKGKEGFSLLDKLLVGNVGDVVILRHSLEGVQVGVIGDLVQDARRAQAAG